MKKHLLLLSIITAGFFSAKSQSIQIIDTTGGTLTPSTGSFTVNIYADSSDTRIFYVKNVTSGAINIQLKSYVVNNPNGELLDYCIGTQCHGTGAPATTNISLAGNNMLTSDGLIVEFTDFAEQGTAEVLYTLFKTTNPNDSTSLRVFYNVVPDAAGIKQNVANYNVSNIAPNPASNNISISHDLKNANQAATVKIYNMLGTLVKTTALDAYNNSTKIDISSLEEGMYIYSVTVGAKVIKTNRLVVAR